MSFVGRRISSLIHFPPSSIHINVLTHSIWRNVRIVHISQENFRRVSWQSSVWHTHSSAGGWLIVDSSNFHIFHPPTQFPWSAYNLTRGEGRVRSTHNSSLMWSEKHEKLAKRFMKRSNSKWKCCVVAHAEQTSQLFFLSLSFLFSVCFIFHNLFYILSPQSV